MSMHHRSFFFKGKEKEKDAFRDVVVTQKLIGWAFSSDFGLHQVGKESRR